MGKKKFAREPLLYIHQPTNHSPEAPMQYNYVTPKKANKAVQQESAPAKPAQKRPIKRNTYYQQLSQTESIESEMTLDDHEGDDADKPESKEQDKTTKFKDMTIEEKVAYFVNTPSYVPKMRCELKTDEKTYRGHITDFKENDVFMRVGKRSSNTKIPIDTVVGIRMLGF